MKRLSEAQRKISTILGAALLVLPLCGCIPALDERGSTGTLLLSFSPRGALRVLTVQPDVDMTIASYSIRGEGPGGAEFEAPAVPPGASSAASLVPGQWVVYVDAYNAEELPKRIGEGLSVTEIAAGQVSTAEVEVVPLEGEGSLSVSISWPANILTDPELEGRLSTSNGTPVPVLFELTDTSATWSGESLPGGYYLLSVELSDGAAAAWGTVEATRVIASEVTSVQYVLEADTNRGGLNIIIEPQLENPVEVTLSVGDETSVVRGSELEVSAITGVSVESYQWYLQGSLQSETGSEIIVDTSALPIGIYSLDVLVALGPVLSSAHAAVHVVEISPDAHIADDVRIGTGVVIYDGVTIRRGAVIGDYVTIFEDATIGTDVTIGNYSVIGAKTVIRSGATLGDRSEIGEAVVIGVHASLGSDVVVGDGAIIRADATIGNGVGIGAGAQIANEVSVADGVAVGYGTILRSGGSLGADSTIGNEVTIGKDFDIAAEVSIHDGTTIGANVRIAEAVVIGQSCRIGKNVTIGAGAIIGNNVTIRAGCVIPDGAVIPDGSIIRP